MQTIHHFLKKFQISMDQLLMFRLQRIVSKIRSTRIWRRNPPVILWTLLLMMLTVTVIAVGTGSRIDLKPDCTADNAPDRLQCREVVTTSSIHSTNVNSSATAEMNPDTAAMSLKFKPINFPVSVREKSNFSASSSVQIKNKNYSVAYHTLLKAGDELNGVVFGQVVDINGKPLVNKDGSPNICSTPDFTNLIQTAGKIFMITHFECRIAVMYLTELKQDMTTGRLTPVSTRPINFSEVSGGTRHCAGMLSPWNTHLGSEEDVRDARKLKADGTLDKYYEQTARYLAGQPASPYMWGWIPEISILDGTGDTRVVKHYAMGRLSSELAYVLPDERTVLISEDDTNSPLIMFIADRPRDLSAGTLYAAKWRQWGRGGGSGELQWINLGHATNEEIRKLVTERTTFDHLFDAVLPDADGKCPEGFKSINAEFGHECLAVRNSMETAASRLETGRFAAYQGATSEFYKLEGATFDPDTKRIYIAVSRIRSGMLDDHKTHDKGGANDVRMPKNSCGAIFALDTASNKKDSTGKLIDSDYVFDKMYSLISGRPRSYEDSALRFNKCDIDGIAEPDNLTYLPGYGVLIIAEDTSKHEIDMVWAYEVGTGRLTRIQSTPYGSEATGTYWHPDINGWGYLTSVIQHPFAKANAVPKELYKQISAEQKRSPVGYIGPFPSLSTSRVK